MLSQRIQTSLIFLVFFGLLCCALFPIFAKTDTRPMGSVTDGNNNPIPGATLRFRDKTGRVVATVTTGPAGTFRRSGMRRLSQYTIDGFLMTRYSHSSGGTDRYYFAPAGRQEFRLRDAAGKPMANLPVHIFLNTSGRYLLEYLDSIRPEQRTRPNGTVAIENFPVSARLGIDTRDPRYAVGSMVTTVEDRMIRYEVTIVPSATITGRLLSAEGKPVSGYSVVPRRTNEPGAFVSWDGTCTTGTSGDFRLKGLRPGTYSVFALEPRYKRRVTHSERVRVASGETGTIELRITDLPDELP